MAKKRMTNEDLAGIMKRGLNEMTEHFDARFDANDKS